MTRKLNIGCGKCYLPREEGWTNVDIFSSVQADVYSDMASLPFDRESFDLIYASHVLEHSHRHTVLSVLAHWRGILKRGGILRLAVPDFAAVVKRYSQTGDLKEVTGLLYGGQNHPKNVHTITFDEKTLSEALYTVGFASVKHWDWKRTEHAGYDDFSQARLPHMSQSSDAVWCSLNLEAIK